MELMISALLRTLITTLAGHQKLILENFALARICTSRDFKIAAYPA